MHGPKVPGFLQNGKRRALIPLVVLVLVGLVAAGVWFLQDRTSGGVQTYSGTIEATEIHLATDKGGHVDAVNVHEGEKISSGKVVAVVNGDFVRSPIDAVVLERVVEPGEVASLGATIVTISNLDELKLTVYVPEDRYGRFMLGQTCRVAVDSFPAETFSGTVSHIADQAEFTPRNVQTVDSRKTTVFAIRFDLAPAGGKLKPGMPADVSCDFDQ
jgi:multidrug resistance efflux pump